MDLSQLWLAILALGAALINGGIGYGFSSVITPIAILWYSNKVLNPALVLVEIIVNIALLLRERRHVRATWPRARSVIPTLLPGIILGTLGLAFLAVNDVKVIVYVALLPLVILQLLGISRPVKNERTGGAAVGVGIGFLYSLTTISGPPLALFLRNQGLSKDQFRCTIAQIRVAESTLTLGTYLAFDQFLSAKLVTIPSLSLLPYLLVPVVIGVPIGTLFLTKVSPEFFRRFVMGADGLFVSYGLSRVLVSLKWITNATSEYLVAALFAFIAVLAWLSVRSLRRHPSQEPPTEPPSPQSLPLPGGGAGSGPPSGPLT
jgi:uncharacterized protein